MIFNLTSKDNPKIKEASSLKESKFRDEKNMFLAEGQSCLELALKTDSVVEIFTLRPLKNIPNSIPQYIVNDDLIKKVAFSKNPEGIVFVCKKKEQNYDNSFKKILFLDQINDPGNLGTLIRTALAFNYDAVICNKNSVSFYNEKTVSASKGAIFLIPCLKAELEDIRNNYCVIASTLNEDSINYLDLKIPEKFILVLGNETHGISEKTASLADFKVKIPISNIDSLNVSIAGGILMNYYR